VRFEETPVLEPRTAVEMLAALRDRRSSFVPEWLAAQDAGDALQRIVARYAQIVADRLNQAPDRAFLAFLDMLGTSLIPARPARAPVVFKAFAGMGDGQVAASSRVGASVEGVPAPVVFETESTIALAGARLTDIRTVWPDRDAYADHSSDAAGGRPFTLFQPLLPVPHILYLAHETAFDVAQDASVEVAIELTTPGSEPLRVAWQYWDGHVWQAFKAFDASDPNASQDGTGGFTRSGTVSLRPTCGRPSKTKVAGINALWIRARADEPLPPDPSRTFASMDRVRARALVNTTPNLDIDAAFAGPLKLDVTSTFFPFGAVAVQGALFYLANEEAFSKHGASVNIAFTLAAPVPLAYGGTGVRWQYWNGDRWLGLPGVADAVYFAVSGTNSLAFTVPADLSPVEIGGEARSWIRAQIVRGGYFFKNTIKVTGPPDQSIDVVEPAAPAIEHVTVTYRWRPAFQPVQQCWTYNDFQYQLRSSDVRGSGDFFQPFAPVADATPALYLGFDGPLPNDLVSVYFDVAESGAPMPPSLWEAWDGEQWRPVSGSDDTAFLARPGIVSFIVPPLLPRPKADVKLAADRQVLTASPLQAAAFQAGQLVVVSQNDKNEATVIAGVDGNVLALETPLADRYNMGTVSLAPLARFGVPRDWLRTRLKENGAAQTVAVNGIFLNATWANQTQTIANEVLGSGNGQLGQTLFFSQFPILPGEVIEVRELDGARAAVEWPILRDELLAGGFTDDDLRTVVDPRTGKVREVWVRWQWRPHFFFSSPTDRHYVIERARGRLLFGDGNNGRLPTVGIDNIRARVYRAGGGLVGNVPRGTITQLLGGTLAESVSNPVAAAGGADGESATAVKDRGPETLRHRWRAISTSDFEAMAREASPGVAAVRVLPATTPNKRPAAGWVTVIIVPQSHEARPQPSYELRREVHDYLAERLPATLDPDHVAVIGPTYRPVGVAALVTPRVRAEAGIVGARVKGALATFLHPLTGGPEGRGWDFGRDVFLSDVAALVEAVSGVDHVRQLDLLLDDAPVGTRVPVPPDQIVVAGDLQIGMEAGGV
jgi:hypothetical protein